MQMMIDSAIIKAIKDKKICCVIYWHNLEVFADH
jgi:hypothetical protein